MRRSMDRDIAERAVHLRCCVVNRTTGAVAPERISACEWQRRRHYKLKKRHQSHHGQQHVLARFYEAVWLVMSAQDVASGAGDEAVNGQESVCET